MFASSLGAATSTAPVPITKITHMAHPPIDTAALMKVINPAAGVQLPVIYASIRPKLVDAACGMVRVCLADGTGIIS